MCSDSGPNQESTASADSAPHLSPESAGFFFGLTRMASIIFKIPARNGKRRGPSDARSTMSFKRDKVLFKLGFASYRDYLKSALWKGIRAAKLADEPACELCGCAASQVHHLDYSHSCLIGKKPWKLVCVCDQCHRKVEYRADGSKRNFEAAMKKTRELLRKQGAWEKHKFTRKSPSDAPDAFGTRD